MRQIDLRGTWIIEQTSFAPPPGQGRGYKPIITCSRSKRQKRYNIGIRVDEAA
jgi:hypothetical protein